MGETRPENIVDLRSYLHEQPISGPPPVFIPSMRNQQRLNFVALHGAWHGPESFSMLREAMAERGHRLFTPNMPIEDPTACYSDYADMVAEELTGYDNLHIIAHSRASNVAPLVASRIKVDSISYVCGTVPATKEDQIKDELDESPEKYTDQFRKGVITEGEITTFDPKIAREVFYADCDPDVAELAVKSLRAQRIRETNIILPSRPRSVELAIVGTYDKAIRPEWQRARAFRLLGKTAVEIPTGHSPFLSKPEHFAALLLSNIQSGFTSPDGAHTYS